MVALESAELFRHLKPAELKALRQVAMERTFTAGHEIFHQGDDGDGVYVVKAGRVEISGFINQDTRRVFSEIGPGDLFGEMAVIEHRPRSATATAAQPTTVYFLPRGELLHLIERSPGLALSLLQVISQRLRDFNQHYLREVVQAEQLAVIGRFARSIVHDLKNPLNIIGLTAEMASLPTTPEHVRTTAHVRIRKQIDRISDLIGDILLFTQGGQAAVTLVPVDYAAFIQELVEELSPELELKSVRIVIENPPPTVTLPLDVKKLRRVFVNLMHNATEAMSAYGKIILRFGVADGEVITEIEDTGPGIPPEIADSLFQAFATHGKAHGTGLGLSICKKIVEDHGGRIGARNEPGRGAIFSFTLPLTK